MDEVEMVKTLEELKGRLERLEYAVLTPAHKEAWGTFYPSDPEYEGWLEDQKEEENNG